MYLVGAGWREGVGQTNLNSAECMLHECAAPAKLAHAASGLFLLF